MKSAPPFTLTNESITIVWEGKPVTVQKGSPNFLALRSAIIGEDWDAIPNNLTIAKSVSDWAKGEFTYDGSFVYYKNEKLPNGIASRIVEMATRGEDPTCLFKFWERLSKNPSYRSVNQLWDFLNHKGIPITEDGCFLAYKSVRQDYKDHHSGQFDNSPGTVNEMPRNKISDDPREACHEGFHVGALAYASTFVSGSRIVVCKVDPENVVCVPFDASSQKMRVSKYEVIGNHNGELLPSTTFRDDVMSSSSPAVDEYESGDYDEDEEDDYEDSYEEEDEDELNEDEDELDEEDEEGDVERDEDGDPTERCDRSIDWKHEDDHRCKNFDKLNYAKLLEESIEDLRKYAANQVKIVGASKIPGGKVALVNKIIEVRKK